MTATEAESLSLCIGILTKEGEMYAKRVYRRVSASM